MTQKEIEKFLDNTKVYVNGKSKEIQEKLFSLGYSWDDDITVVCHTGKPFIYIWEDKRFSHGNNMNIFNGDSKREITAEKILSLELTEPSYRPFKDSDECWQEMLKHEPFGWVKYGAFMIYKNITIVDNNSIYMGTINTYLMYQDAFTRCAFVDGTPFGFKEE